MPYQNFPPNIETSKIDSCVNDVMAQGHPKESAIAICYNSLVNGATIEDSIIMLKEGKLKPMLAAPVRGELVALAEAEQAGQILTIQLLRAGEFTDMHGLDVTVGDGDLETYAANSNAVLAAKNIPAEIGHPQDPGAPAAAWYKRFFVKSVNGVQWVCAQIELSALGARSLADQLYKYFSASLDLEAKQIIGGGFVNRPAVSGQLPVGSLSQYLRPRGEVRTMALDQTMLDDMAGMVEKMLKKMGTGVSADANDQAALDSIRSSLTTLFQALKGQGAATSVDQQGASGDGGAGASTSGGGTSMAQGVMTKAELDAKLAQVRDEERQRMLAQQKEHERQLAEAREDERKRVLAEQARKSEIVALAAELTSGPKAMYQKPSELEELFAALTDDDRKLIAPVLRDLRTKGFVDLGEHGTQRDGSGGKQELPDYARRLLHQWLAQKGNDAAAFFTLNKELGKAEDYNLAEFQSAT